MFACVCDVALCVYACLCVCLYMYAFVCILKHVSSIRVVTAVGNDMCVRVCVQRGNVIVKEGDNCPCLFVVREGYCLSSRLTAVPYVFAHPVTYAC